MNVNQKGMKGLLQVMADLHQRNFYLFPAFDDYSPIDLVAASPEGKLYRFQVKYKTVDPRAKRPIYGLSATTVNGGVKRKINLDMIDGWAVYLSNDDKVVYVHKKMLGEQTSITINTLSQFIPLEEW